MSDTQTGTSLDGFHDSESAQRADLLVRKYFDTLNQGDNKAIDTLLTRNFQSYTAEGVLSRTGTKERVENLHSSFSDLRFDVHENIGVLVEGDLLALRTIITGTHSGEYAGVAATGKAVQTSATHIFRHRDDELVEHWEVLDSYRILTTIGAVPPFANIFQQMLGIPLSPGGVFAERLGTPFDAPRSGRPATREESRFVNRWLYNSAIATGDPTDVEAQAENYIQNNGASPDGRDLFGQAWAVMRPAMPDGRATNIFVVAEHDRVASISVWDGTALPTGKVVDFKSGDFLRIENGVAAEHWDTVDYISLFESLGVTAAAEDQAA